MFVFRRVVPDTQKQDLQNAKERSCLTIQNLQLGTDRQTVTTWVAQYLQWPSQGIDYTTVGGAPFQTTILSPPWCFAQFLEGGVVQPPT